MMVARRPMDFAGCAAAVLWIILPLVTSLELPNLRILPLGDSITEGGGSTDHNGYREHLRNNLLTYNTDTQISVDMIGTLHTGTMVDNDHEGHSGKYMEDIDTYWQAPFIGLPNLVLIHAGTNNMDKNRGVAEAPGLMSTMLDDMVKRNPDVVIIVAEIIHSKTAAMNERSAAFNAKLRNMVKDKRDAGKHILTVDMGIVNDDLFDLKHPDNGGYQKMASGWKTGILKALEYGWIKSPKALPVLPIGVPLYPGIGNGNGNEGSGNFGCSPTNWEKKGVVFDDFRVWEEIGTIMRPLPNAARYKVRFADLNGDGIDDYILADDDGTVRAWLNKGRPNEWTSLGDINPPWSSITGKMVRLADVDGDGRADMIALYSDGAAKVWKNVDNGKKFEPLDSKWATGLAASDKIWFQDVDGDGYADYVIIEPSGAVKWARNTGNNGKDQSKRNWETVQQIAPGPNGIPDNIAHLHDIDGDGKADYLIIYGGGAVKAFTNTGNLNSNSGRNWNDLGTIAPGVSGVTGEMIRFADADGDGLADFLAVADDGSVRMWRNMGVVGSSSATIRFANLTGNGKDDIIFVDAHGRARAYLNKGLGQRWENVGEIAPGLNEDLSSARIEFVDVNGDKRADFLVIYGGGAVKAYLNNGNIPDAGKGRIWQEPIVISPGVGEPGRKVSFADLNNDGYADYVVIDDNGAVNGYLNLKNIPPSNGGRIWSERFLVATGVGLPGSYVRFADITGDGRDEYIIQYNGGAAKAYLNTANMPDAGKSKNWYGMGVIAAGVTPQGPVRYADINGDGKADYLTLNGHGAVSAWSNTCDWKEHQSTGSPGDPGGVPPPDSETPKPIEEIDQYSTCGDLEDAALVSFQQELWDQTQAGLNLQWWILTEYEDRKDKESLVREFANDWSIKDYLCDIYNDCETPLCIQYDPKEGSGWAHAVLKSIQNLHSYLSDMKKAVETAGLYFENLKEIFVLNYYPAPDPKSPLKDIMDTLSGLFGFIGAVGGEVGGATSALFDVIGSQVDDTQEKSEVLIGDIATLGTVGQKFLNTSFSMLDDMHTNLIGKGFYKYEKYGQDRILDLVDVFEHGKWLQTNKIPILNQDHDEHDDPPGINTSKLADLMFNWLHASILNYSWKQSIIWIVSYPMTQEEFKKEDRLPATLKVYYMNRGFFLQSYESEQTTLPPHGTPVTVVTGLEPPGHDSVTNQTLSPNFNVPDIIKSSVDTFDIYGFEKNEGGVMNDFLDGSWKSGAHLTPRYGGFNIPVCYVDKNHFDNVGDFMDALLSKGTTNSNLGIVDLLCFCQSYADNSGNTLGDQLPKEMQMKC